MRVVVTLGDVLRRSAEFLAERGCETARLDAERLIGHALGLERIELYMHLDRPLTEPEVAAARELVARRGRREPVQHLLGEWGFRRLTLRVDGRALIPRPETEVVVERCLALLHADQEPRVLDVGTGTGAIALAIADEHPAARVTAIDSSADAIALAGENVGRTGLPVELLLHDLFTGLPAGPWDLVVSNPPYVVPGELDGLAPEVREWEPHAALAANGHTEAVITGAAAVLRPGGALVLEVHGEGAAAVAELLREGGFTDVVVTADLAGRERVVEGRRPADMP
ncbi:MAG: peptide chain release factor N(5)-glutamine methyltransferase [Thermoleophilia bacterium]|nr:peptide chain release factor N(5)-glutamine methyltransferase [Thermoleophilia bacterium]